MSNSICRACGVHFVPSTRLTKYCDKCRAARKVARVGRIISSATCPASGTQFVSRAYIAKYCRECRYTCCFNYSPAVYRFIAPNGMSYVGSTFYSKSRAIYGLQRSNDRLSAAQKKYPSETWCFEILERLPSKCSKRELREAEQRHIERFATLDPECGFNMNPAFGSHKAPSRSAIRGGSFLLGV